MFTGIITDIGVITRASGATDKRVYVKCAYPSESLQIGESIACSGACLTVIEIGAFMFAADVSAETIRCTVPGMWEEGWSLNLERALQVGDRLGGHFVTGHVDGVARVEAVQKAHDSYKIDMSAPVELMRYIAKKGSVTLDGVSLTVNAVQGAGFSVNIIPHTWEYTTLSSKQVGQGMNLEVDLVARYLETLMQR